MAELKGLIKKTEEAMMYYPDVVNFFNKVNTKYMKDRIEMEYLLAKYKEEYDILYCQEYKGNKPKKDRAIGFYPR